MKRKITLSIALVLSITILALMRSDSTAQAQNQIKIVADTGVVHLGQGQTLRLSIISPRDSVSGQSTGVRIRKSAYTEEGCNGAVCKHVVSSQNASELMMLAPNEALEVDLDWSANVSGNRVVVFSNNQDLQVNVMIIESATGRILSIDKSTPLIMKG
jgi:hypothetical protein